MTEKYEFPEEPSDDFRNLLDELTNSKITPKEIKSVTHQNSTTRWHNLDGFPIRELFFFAAGLSCDSRALFVVLNYDADNNSYVYHHIELANGDEFKRFWCD